MGWCYIHAMAHTSQKKKASQRRITIVRHAKAAPDDGALGDHARPLNARGREDALALGAWLKESHALPQVILCSTATRTRETLAALKLDLPVVLTDKLYLASVGEMIALLQEEDDANQHVMLIGHNPGMHALVVSLAREYVREDDAEAVMLKFPTSALASMTVDCARWKDLAPQSATVDAFRLARP